MTRPIQCVQFTLRTEYDSVTIDGKTYTTPELRAALSTTPDQGDERRAMTAAYLAFCADKAPDHNEVGFPYFKAAWQARAAQPVAQPVVDQKTASVSDNGSCGSQVSDKPVAQEAIGPIDRDEQMDRTYIPLPGGWEVQTQGKGSSFRLCNTESGHRWIVTDKRLHPVLEEMAREIHAASLAAPPHSSQPETVAVSGEVSGRLLDEDGLDSVAGILNDYEAERIGLQGVFDAVLALAGSGGKRE